MALSLIGCGGKSNSASSAGVSGDFTGTAKGMGGDVTVTLTLTDGKITGCTAEGADETEGVGSKAIEQLPGEIAESGSIEVDGVSGATITSNAIKEAAAAAITAAGLKPEDFQTAVENNAEPAEDSTVDTDIVIVGAGGAGMTAALTATSEGKSVVITYSNIKIATIGDSESVAVGSPAIAIGNALGYGQSVTTGIVSALNRTVTTQDSQTGETVTNNKLIQTDAAINPGNSGGALLNENGEVIGINSVKYSSTEVEGIGYAIPMSVAKPIIESLIQDGKYTNENQAYLGIKGGDVSSEMVAYGFPQGVYVSSVSAGSGAANAGLQEGDIITAVDSTKISSMTELQSALKSYKAGDKVTLTVARQSGRQYEESKVEVTLSSAKDIQQ